MPPKPSRRLGLAKVELSVTQETVESFRSPAALTARGFGGNGSLTITFLFAATSPSTAPSSSTIKEN